MSKKIEWIKRGMTANNGLHMQEVCDQIADATTAINNSLQKPTTTPSATQLVAVDNTNTQTMLNIGDGLSVENGSLKASGGQLYRHNLSLSYSNNQPFITLAIIAKNNAVFTYNTLRDYLLNNELGVSSHYYPVNGIYKDYDLSIQNLVLGIRADSSQIFYKSVQLSNSIGSSEDTINTSCRIVDIINEI